MPSIASNDNQAHLPYRDKTSLCATYPCSSDHRSKRERTRALIGCQQPGDRTNASELQGCCECAPATRSWFRYQECLWCQSTASYHVLPSHTGKSFRSGWLCGFHVAVQPKKSDVCMSEFCWNETCWKDEKGEDLRDFAFSLDATFTIFLHSLVLSKPGIQI